MVVICAPAPTSTGDWQERVAWPSTCTVQAPHWAMPQPYLVPVRPSVSRSTQSSGVSGLDVESVGLAVDGELDHATCLPRASAGEHVVAGPEGGVSRELVRIREGSGAGGTLAADPRRRGPLAPMDALPGAVLPAEAA